MLIVVCGIPGSGKSTYVEKKTDLNAVVICPDSIRKELTGDESNQSKNNKVFEIAHERVNKSLQDGKDVIFDATNVSKRSRSELIKIAKAQKVECIAAYTTTPLEICLERNSKRDRVVPEDVIVNMYERYTYPQTTEGFARVEEICS